jgi:hypothetical protein
MGNPILLMQNAGFGETPVPADALLQPGATMVINDENDGSKSDAVVLAVVPKGGCIEYAIADQNGQPRPLVVSDNHSGQTLYVIEHNGRRLYVPQRQMKKGLDAAEAAGLNGGADV